MAGRHFKTDEGATSAPIDSDLTGGAQSSPDSTANPLDSSLGADATPFVADPSPEGGKIYYEPGKKHISRQLRRSQVSTSSGVRRPHHHHHHHHRGSRSRKRSVVLGGLAVLLFLILCAGAAALAHLNNKISLGGEVTELKSALAEEQATQNDGFYVLLVGSDAREGDTFSRGDVLMLCRIDPVKRVVTLVSIPRDTMVNIPGAVGIQKINAAYAFGGASSQVYTVSKFAGVPISHYVEVDFEGTENLVDLLGGVWVDVPEAVSNSNVPGGRLEAGRQLLDGKTALSYARERYSASGGDFSRARAQRLIVQAIIRQTMQASPLEMPGLIEGMAGCISTDYSIPDIVALAFKFRGGSFTVYSAVTPSYSLWQDGVSYVGTEFAEWQDMMRRVDAGLDPNDTTAAIPEPQASNEELGKAENSEAPKDYAQLVEQGLTTDAAGTDAAAEIDGGSAGGEDVTVLSDDTSEESTQ